MNILLFSYLNYDNLDYKGGNWILTLCEHLSKSKKHKIAIAYPSSKLNKYIRNGITYYPIPAHKTFIDKLKEVILNKPKFVTNIAAVDFIVQDFNPSIIQLFGLETEFSQILYHVNTVPIVVHLQGICEPIIDRWFPVGINKAWVKKQYPLKNQIMRINTTDKYYRTRQIEKIEKKSYSHYRYYFGRTKWDKALCLQFSRNAKYYSCNEILRDVFYSTEWKKPNNTRIIVSISNGEIYKGFDVILRTAKCLKENGVEFQWKVIGIEKNDPILKIIEKHYRLCFNDYHVEFYGKRNADEIVEILQNASVFVHPTHVDNSPNSLCEAMIMGVPCVATYVGGIPSLITDGKDGFLFPEGDYLFLTSILEMLLSSEMLQMDISVNARKHSLIRHNPEAIVDNLIENYKNIIYDFNSKFNE